MSQDRPLVHTPFEADTLIPILQIEKSGLRGKGTCPRSHYKLVESPEHRPKTGGLTHTQL